MISIKDSTCVLFGFCLRMLIISFENFKILGGFSMKIDKLRDFVQKYIVINSVAVLQNPSSYGHDIFYKLACTCTDVV